MPPAPEGIIQGGAVPPGPPGQVWDEWPPSISPLLTESSGRDDRSWSIAGRRALVSGSARGGVREIRVHPFRIVCDASLEVGGRSPDTVALRVAPDEVVRVLQAGEVQLAERLTTALDQGLVFWSIVADGPVPIRLTWTTDLRVSSPPNASPTPQHFTLARAAGRVKLAGLLERTISEQREEARDRFDPAEWRQPGGARPDHAALILGVVEGLWGVRPDALRGELRLAPAPPDGWMEMALRRVRVGPTTVDLRLRRRPERTVLAVRRAAGPAIRLRVGLPGRRTRGPVTVDQTELGGAEVTFTAEDVHEVAFHNE